MRDNIFGESEQHSRKSGFNLFACLASYLDACSDSLFLPLFHWSKSRMNKPRWQATHVESRQFLSVEVGVPYLKSSLCRLLMHYISLSCDQIKKFHCGLDIVFTSIHPEVYVYRWDNDLHFIVITMCWVEIAHLLYVDDTIVTCDAEWSS